MKISIKGFIYPKIAEKYSDCFDRYGFNAETNKIAISDGVSKSFFPGVWAEILVNKFISTKGPINLVSTSLLESSQSDWVDRVQEIVNRPNQKYFVRNFFAQGRSAAATFVGLHFYDEEGKFKWDSFALGDSFLFFIPKEIHDLTQNFDSITYLSSKHDFEFNNFPDFFDSRNKINKGKIKQCKGNLTEGTFYLMTDAAAEWFIASKQDAIEEINKWNSPNDFEKRIDELRKGEMQNDDTTIIIIKIEEDNIPKLNYEEIDIPDFMALLQAETLDMESEGDMRPPKKNELQAEVVEEKEVEINVKGEQGKRNIRDGFNKNLPVLYKRKTSWEQALDGLWQKSQDFFTYIFVFKKKEGIDEEMSQIEGKGSEIVNIDNEPTLKADGQTNETAKKKEDERKDDTLDSISNKF